MEGTFVVWMIGVVVLVAAQLIEYVLESNRTRTGRLRFPMFARDLPPRDATESEYRYEQAA
jgi:hypothetical protein